MGEYQNYMLRVMRHLDEDNTEHNREKSLLDAFQRGHWSEGYCKNAIEAIGRNNYYNLGFSCIEELELKLAAYGV